MSSAELMIVGFVVSALGCVSIVFRRAIWDWMLLVNQWADVAWVRVRGPQTALLFGAVVMLFGGSMLVTGAIHVVRSALGS